MPRYLNPRNWLLAVWFVLCACVVYVDPDDLDKANGGREWWA